VREYCVTEIICADCGEMNEHCLRKYSRCNVCGGLKERWVIVKYRETFFKRSVLWIKPYDEYPERFLEILAKNLELDDLCCGECDPKEFLKGMIEESLLEISKDIRVSCVPARIREKAYRKFLLGGNHEHRED